MIKGLNKITEAAGLGYLMSSYTSHPAGFGAAQEDAEGIAADMLQAGLVVFAPIAYGPALDRRMCGEVLPSDSRYYRSHEFWMPICERFFERCDYGIIAMTPGWEKSQGIAIELFDLTRRRVPVWFYDQRERRIMTFNEAAEEREDELEELMQRAGELQTKHLNSATEVYTNACWDAFVKLAGADV